MTTAAPDVVARYDPFDPDGMAHTHEHAVVSSPEFARDYPELAWPDARAAAVTRVAELQQMQSDRARKVIEASMPMHRIASAAECAESVVWLLSDGSAFVTGVGAQRRRGAQRGPRRRRGGR